MMIGKRITHNTAYASFLMTTPHSDLSEYVPVMTFCSSSMVCPWNGGNSPRPLPLYDGQNSYHHPDITRQIIVRRTSRYLTSVYDSDNTHATPHRHNLRCNDFPPHHRRVRLCNGSTLRHRSVGICGADDCGQSADGKRRSLA